MDSIEQQIFKYFSQNGMKDIGEYEQKITRVEITSELIRKGYDKERIDRTIEKLCQDGTLAMDEQDIYLYDDPPPDV